MTNPRPSSVERERIREERRAELLRANERQKRTEKIQTIAGFMLIIPVLAGVAALVTGAAWWAALWFWTNLPG